MVSLTGHLLLHHKREVGSESVRQSPAGSARGRELDWSQEGEGTT